MDDSFYFEPDDSMFSKSNLMFDIFPIFFGIIFVLVAGVIIFNLIKGVTTWNKNNHSPVLDVQATVVTKREDIRHRTNSDHMASHTRTLYYVTFQVESGDRMEFEIPGDVYGMLVEGDFGKLTFQGTRYLGFER